MVSFERKTNADATHPGKWAWVEQGKKFDYRKLEGLKHEYTVGRRIGEGGMGAVWAAVRDDGTEVVIKEILEVAANAHEQTELLERFIQEGLVLEEIDSAHFPKFYETNPKNTVLVMERLRGRTLDQRLEEKEEISPREAFHIASEVAAGMFHAHERGYFHRDLKPTNIFIEDSGQIKILDVGLALLSQEKRSAKRRGTRNRLTTPGTVMGSPHYISPEQVRGDDVETESDVFSLGCNVYEMLTGYPPFYGHSIKAIVEKISKGIFTPLEQKRPDLPPAVTMFVNSMLELEPAHRPTMDQVSKFFRQCEEIETS